MYSVHVALGFRRLVSQLRSSASAVQVSRVEHLFSAGTGSTDATAVDTPISRITRAGTGTVRSVEAGMYSGGFMTD